MKLVKIMIGDKVDDTAFYGGKTIDETCPRSELGAVFWMEVLIKDRILFHTPQYHLLLLHLLGSNFL